MNNIDDIILTMPSDWYYDNGYLTISLELFGKYLCAIFNEFLEDYYYFKKFTPTIRTDRERPIWQQGEESKKLAIISPISHDEDSQYNYNKVKVVNMAYPKPKYLEAFTLHSKEYPSMFAKSPLNLDEKEFMLYFGNYDFDYVKVYLGHIENCRFVPTDRFKNSSAVEIIYSNPIYPFVEEFIKDIFYYKLFNAKPNLDHSDMELILENFGISRKEKLQKMVCLLNNIQNKSTEILLNSNNVGNVLSLKKNSLF